MAPYRTVGRVCLSALTLGLAGLPAMFPAVGWAGDLSEQLATAQKALVEKDTKAAQAAVDEAEASSAELDSVAVPEVVGKVHYYRGMGLYMDGDRDGAMQEWRVSLMIDNNLQWDESIAKDAPAQDLFEALRKEVNDRYQVDALIPPKLGLAKLYIDGKRVCPGDKVREGEHLVQVDCPDDRIYGEWVEFPKKKVKWLKLCPRGVDVEAIPEPEEEVEEDMFSFGDALGDEEEGCAVPGDEGAEGGEEVVAEEIPDAPLTPPPGNAPLIEHRVSWPMVAAGGGLLLGGGTALAIATSRRSAFDAEYTTFTSVGQVETRAAEVNRVAWIGTGLSVVGGGLCVAAVIPW